MSSSRRKISVREIGPGLGLAAGMVFCLFHYFGNAALGYIHSASLFHWWGVQWRDPAAETQHGILVVAVSLWLFWRSLRARPAPLYPEKHDIAIGLSIVTAALGLHVLAYGMEQTRISIVAFLLCVDGLLRIFGGASWEKAARFPLFFALLSIPFSFLQPLGFYLRLAVSQGAEWAVQGLHWPIVRSGTQLFSPDGRYQYDVAAACSGIRSLVAFFALSLVLGYVRLSGFWRRACLVALVVPIVLTGNLARILAIIFAAQLRGQEAGERVHEWSGWVIYFVVFGLLWLCARRLENDSAKTNAVVEPNPLAMNGGAFRSATFAGVIVALGAGLAAYGCLTLDRRLPDPRAGVRLAANAVDPIELPAFLGTEWIGQRSEVTAVERSVLPPDTGYSRKNYIAVRDRSEVFVSVVLSGRDRTSIHRPELCLVGQGWHVVSESAGVLRNAEGQEMPATFLKIEKDFARPNGPAIRVKSLLAYTFIGPDRIVASHAQMVWQSSLARLRRLRGDRWAYVIVQTRAEENDVAATERIEDVFSAVWGELRDANGNSR